jgi:hypothetical protein
MPVQLTDRSISLREYAKQNKQPFDQVMIAVGQFIETLQKHFPHKAIPITLTEQPDGDVIMEMVDEEFARLWRETGGWIH